MSELFHARLAAERQCAFADVSTVCWQVMEGLNDTAETLLASIESDEAEVSPSTLYATAAILEGVPYVNGAPQNTFVPGLIDLAIKHNVLIGARRCALKWCQHLPPFGVWLPYLPRTTVKAVPRRQSLDEALTSHGSTPLLSAPQVYHAANVHLTTDRSCSHGSCASGST